MGDGPVAPPTRPRGRGTLILLLKIVVAIAAVILGLRLVRRIDWAQVFDAVGQLRWWQVIVVVLLVLGRQTLMASPLVFLVPGLGVRRAVMNGLSGTLITTFMPPPAEIVLRLSMFKSWKLDAFQGASALALNTLLFYMARFVAPIFGLIFAVGFASAGPVYWLSALVGAVVTTLLVGGLSLVSKGASLADKVGRKAGNVVRRVRKTVDPRAWSRALVKFQQESSAGLARRMLPSGAGLVGFLLVDGTIVVFCLRALGVSAAELSYGAVIAAFLCVYPFTIFPFAGIGILDASLVLLLNDVRAVDQADLVAALVVWRAATLAFPLVPGLGAFAWWRSTLRTRN